MKRFAPDLLWLLQDRPEVSPFQDGACDRDLFPHLCSHGHLLQQIWPWLSSAQGAQTESQ